MGSNLPSAEEVHIIRRAGKKGRLALAPVTLLPGALPGSRAFQSRIRTQSGPDGMRLLLVSETRFPEKLFPKRFKEPY